MLNDVKATQLRAQARSRRHSMTFQVAMLMTCDAFLIGLSTLMALNGRQSISLFDTSGNDIDAYVRPLAIIVGVLWLVTIASLGGYSTRQFGVGTTEYRRLLNASLVVAAALGVGAFLWDFPLSRGFYFLLFAVGVPLLIVGRAVIRRLVHRARRAGKMVVSVLIAGDHDHVDDVASVLKREPWLGYDVIGALASDEGAEHTRTGIPVFGRPDEAVRILKQTGSNVVIFAEGSFKRGQHFNRVARALEDSHAQMVIVPSLTDVSAERMDIRPVAGIPLVHVERPRARAAGRWWKRVFDVAGSLALIIVGAPAMALLAIAIKLEDRGPVLFKQTRAGLKGEPFECLKFRSMCVDAEAKLAALQHLNASDGVLFKLPNDPRVTKVGGFIRRYSLDELPQLFNVLVGDMSLVGPRPALPSEIARYKQHVLRRLDVRPGMTGLWQVSGRSDLSWDDTVRLDLYYVDNWSMLQDLSILAKTFGAVVGKHGAY